MKNCLINYTVIRNLKNAINRWIFGGAIINIFNMSMWKFVTKKRAPDDIVLRLPDPA